MHILAPENLSCTQPILEEKIEENFPFVLTGRLPQPAINKVNLSMTHKMFVNPQRREQIRSLGINPFFLVHGSLKVQS